jgi:two-component system, sensor histidine kinase and response regulator
MTTSEATVLSPAVRASLPTLLVVDDEEGPRQSLRMVFRHDFDVQVFERGEQAVTFARSHTVHVAILDIRMAGMSGIDVLRALKEADAATEVVLLTAYETLDTARQALRLGACDYLSKPFDLAGIRESVSRALHFRRISETIAETNGRLQGLAGQLRDVAAREEMARTTTEICAGALHDINNPLTVITCYLDLLNGKLKGGGPLHGPDLQFVRDNVGLLSKHVDNCRAITRRYLRFANYQANTASGSMVNQTVDNVRTLVARHPSLRGGALHIQPLGEDMEVQIGSTEFIQVLVNLVVNAFQAGAPGMDVHLIAEKHAQPLDLDALSDGPGRRSVNLAAFNNLAPLVSLSVLDRGSGVPEEILDSIFEPYFTTKEQNGTGLGLAIVARLVKQHSCLLHVQTKQGEGSRFTVYIPCASASRRPAA